MGIAAGVAWAAARGAYEWLKPVAGRGGGNASVAVLVAVVVAIGAFLLCLAIALRTSQPLTTYLPQ